MKLLFITHSIGRTPTGLVAETFLAGLSNHFDPIVTICSSFESNSLQENNVYIVPQGVLLPSRLSKLLLILFRKSLRNFIWEVRVRKLVKRLFQDLKPEIVLSFTARDGESVISLGYWLSQRYNATFAIHMCDPIPPPKGWETYEIYRKALIKPIILPLQNCHLLSMNTTEMIEFLQSQVDFDLLGKSYTCPNPTGSNIKYLGPPSAHNIFLYVGSFYAARKPDLLLEGFTSLLDSGIEAELWIIGHNKLKTHINKLPEFVKRKIRLVKWTSDLEAFYLKASFLVDVDADIEDDVFISSKLMSYLTLDRVILSISRSMSPSSKLLNGVDDSVFKAQFNQLDVYEKMKKCCELSYRESLFEDRLKLISEYSENEVVNKMAQRLDRFSNLQVKSESQI